jgi:Zn-dependent peptidase ImmA (M78 family)
MPNSVIILGRKIAIKYISKEKLHELLPHSEGIWDVWDQTIYINKEAPRKVQLYYIYHEIGHAIFTITGIDQSLPAEFQEIIVQSFASGVQDILNQSSKLK